MGPHINVPSIGFDQRLGTAPIIDLEAEADYAFRGSFHAFLGWRYSRFCYKQSHAAVGYVEPRSETELMSYLAGLRFSF